MAEDMSISESALRIDTQQTFSKLSSHVHESLDILPRMLDGKSPRRSISNLFLCNLTYYTDLLRVDTFPRRRRVLDYQIAKRVEWFNEETQ